MIKLHCGDKHDTGGRCGLVVATIRNGVLVIQSRHYGQEHTAVVTLADLERLMREEKERRELALRP